MTEQFSNAQLQSNTPPLNCRRAEKLFEAWNCGIAPLKVSKNREYPYETEEILGFTDAKKCHSFFILCQTQFCPWPKKEKKKKKVTFFLALQVEALNKKSR